VAHQSDELKYHRKNFLWTFLHSITIQQRWQLSESIWFNQSANDPAAEAA